MVFFKETIDSNCNLKQLEYLREFRSYLEKEGLQGSYKDVNHLKDEISRRLNLFINSIVKTLLASPAQNPTKQERLTAIFSDEEIERLRLWCASDNNFYSKINFEGGGCIYQLGGHQYEVTSGRDIARWSKFIKTLLEQGLIEYTGQYTSQREPLCQLTSKAYDMFS